MEKQKITGNEPATSCTDTQANGHRFEPLHTGLTIRQQIAMSNHSAILTGIYSSKEMFLKIGENAESLNMSIEQFIAELALDKTDAIIKALNETPNPNV